MSKRKLTMSTGNSDGSSVAEGGLDGPWSLQQTLDAYEVEELTSAQASELLRQTRPWGRAPRAEQ
jgi:hypothetical protein